MKRGIYLVLLILLLTTVSAQHTAEIIWNTPAEFYETQNQQITFQVSNEIKSPHSITQLFLDINQLQFTSLTNIGPWVHANETSTANWTGGSIWPFSSQGFIFESKTPEVNQDTISTLTLILKDTQDKTTNYEKQITILNDNIKPTIKDYTPKNYQIIKPQILELTIDAEDKESGLKQISLRYCLNKSAIECKDYTEINELKLDLTQSTDFFNYQLTAEDNAGNIQITLWNNLFIDKEKPTIQLNNPQDNLIINKQQDFKYKADDNSFNLNNNFNPELTCKLIINNKEKQSQQVTNTEEQIIEQGLEDGIYIWKIQCKDKANNKETSEERTLTIDTTPPIINITTNSQVQRNSNLEVILEIEDLTDTTTQAFLEEQELTIENNKITYTIPDNQELGDANLTITAIDQMNYTTTEVKNIEITQQPPEQSTPASTGYVTHKAGGNSKSSETSTQESTESSTESSTTNTAPSTSTTQESTESNTNSDLSSITGKTTFWSKARTPVAVSLSFIVLACLGLGLYFLKEKGIILKNKNFHKHKLKQFQKHHRTL